MTIIEPVERPRQTRVLIAGLGQDAVISRPTALSALSRRRTKGGQRLPAQRASG